MKKFTYKSKYGTYQNCVFVKGKYENGNLALQIISNEEGPITTVTINPGQKIPSSYIAIKNYSENEGMVEFLQSLGIIGTNIICIIPSGYVEIPVFEFNEIILEKYL